MRRPRRYRSPGNKQFLRGLGLVTGFLLILSWAPGALACRESSTHGHPTGMLIPFQLGLELPDTQEALALSSVLSKHIPSSPHQGTGCSCEGGACFCQWLCCPHWQALPSISSLALSPLRPQGGVEMGDFFVKLLLASGIEHPPRSSLVWAP